MLETHNIINDILVNLFHDIWDIEARAICTEEFKDMTVNDMHIIEAIGKDEGKNMSTIARMLGITVGSLTTSMNSLVKKGYVLRERTEEDRRIVNIKLTDKGISAFEHHADFHDKMTKAVVASLSEEEIPVLAKSLTGLAKFFREYKL